MRPSSCAVAQLLYGVLVCGEPVLLSNPFFQKRQKRRERPPAALATSKRVITCPNFGFGSKSFREIGFSSRPRRHINSAFGSARVDLARFKRIKFRRVFLHTIQPPRAIHLSNFVGAENVSFPRHVTSRRPLVSGTATPSPPRTANMNALRLTILAATVAYASAQQGTCEVCHLHYYHKVRPRATMMFRIAVMEKRKKRKAAPSCSSDRCPAPLIRRRTFPTPRPGAPMSPFARSTNTRPAAPRIPLRSEYPVTSNPHRLGLKLTHA